MPVAVIILAAGRGSRMRRDFKLTAPLAGRPLIRHAAENALASGLRPVLIVTGHRADEVGDALGGLDISLCKVMEAELALSASLRAGIQALPAGLAGAIVALGDMPEVPPGLFRRLAAPIASGEALVAVPVANGRRGNPVAFSAQLFPELTQLQGDMGARHLIAAYAPQLVEVPVEDEGAFLDIDTSEQLDALEDRPGEPGRG